jgi:transposase-like protein
MDNTSSYATINEEIEDICFNRFGYPHEWPTHGECPCCGSDRIRYFFSKFKLQHWICRSCKFIFVNPYPSRAAIEAIYNASYYPAVRRYIEIPKAINELQDVSMSTSTKISDEIISYLTQRRKTDGKWLDVGGGIGSFLSFVQKRNPGFDLFLNEMNSESRSFAQNHYSLKVLSDPPEILFSKGLRFDIITILSVFEHISHPLDFIKGYGALLNKGGIILVSIPRFSRLNILLSKSGSNTAAPPYHLSLFNDKNIHNLFERVKLFQSIELWQSGPKAFSLTDMMQVGEYFDIEVPQQEMDAPLCMQVRPYTRFQDKVINKLAKIDHQIEALLTRIDGKLILNIAAVR